MACLKRTAVYLIFITVVGLAAYSNSFKAPFTFDDERYIKRNPTIKDFSYFTDTSRADSLHLGDVIKRYLRTRYVAYLSFWANFKTGGLSVWGYHATNLAVHLSSSLLLYAFVVLTFRTPFLIKSRLNGKSEQIALFAALLFVSHPVQTEAVTYITQRFASLAAMFYLLAFVAYTSSRLTENIRAGYALYALSLASCVLSMKSKEIAFTLPLVLVLYEFLFFTGPVKRRAVFLAPLLLTMLIIPVEYINERMPAGDLSYAVREATRLQSEMPRLEYLFTQFRVLATYARLLVLPVNQNFDYDYPASGSIPDSHACLSFMFLLLVMGLGIYLFYRSRRRPELRLVSFGIFWFYVALSVESGIFPISEIICEYRVYLPSVGAFTGIAASMFIGSALIKNRLINGAVTASLVLAIIALSVLTYSRNALWLDQAGLLEDTVGKSPSKARPRVNLGLVYFRKGRIDDAVEQYVAALELKPYNIVALNNLGTAYLEKGMVEEAIGYYRASLNIRLHTGTIYNLARAYQRKGMMEKAIENYRLALTLRPDSPRAHLNLGLAYLKKGWREKAEEEFRAALRLNPGLKEAREHLDRILQERSGI
jgi:tetratricopeptide (TPR) repeat protein